MEAKQDSLNEQIHQAIVEKIWLDYFNDALLAKGMITPTERRKMQFQIKL